MPDGSTKNPLYVPYPNRSGLGINDANALPPSSVSLACFKDLTFSQFDGDYEETPHGDVHVQVGGASAPGSCNKAWMTQVPCAAQDPIFWLHHANVDRCWDGWLRQGGGRSNPTDASWLNGQYTLFAPNGTAKQMKVQDVLDSAKDLGYVYDQYPAAPAPLIAPAVAPAVPVAAEVVPVSEQRLVAETTEPVIRLTGQTTVSANVVAQEQGVASSEALGAPEAAGTVTLNVEGIDLDAHPGVVYEIYVNLPEGETPDFRSTDLALGRPTRPGWPCFG